MKSKLGIFVWICIISSFIGIFLIVKIHPFNEFLNNVLLHGLEGMFVGGCCDTFAVWKIFNSINAKKEKLADEIAAFVREGILSDEFFKNQFEYILTNPSMVKMLHDKLNEHFPNREAAYSSVEQVWELFEPSIIEKIVLYDFTPSDEINMSQIIQDPSVERNIKICMSHSILKTVEKDAFNRLFEDIVSKQSFMVRSGISLFGVKNTIQNKIKSIAKDLSDETKKDTSEDEQIIYEALDVLKSGVSDYLLAWQHLTIEQKRKGVTAVVKSIKHPICKNIADTILETKAEVKKVGQLWQIDIVHQAIDFVDEQIDESLKIKITNEISKSLREIDLRKVLEPRTTAIFDIMRLMGTMLGGGLGLVVGLIMALVH